MKSLVNPGAATQRRFDFFACVALAVVAIILYLPALGADFVYDARLTVLGNDYVHHLGNLWDVFTLRVMHMDVMDNNRPVYLGTVMLNWAAWGSNPFGHHLCNVVLHAVVAVLLFRLCRSLLPEISPWAPFAAALLFAVHPLECESVSEISYRNDLMVAAFLLAALNLAVVFRPDFTRRNIALGAACVACIFLAVGSKENGIAGPVVLICYWLLFRRNEPRAPWVALCSTAWLVAVAFLVARFTLRPTVSVIFVANPVRPGGTLTELANIQPRIWAFYLKQIVWPGNFSAEYGPYTVRNFDLAVSLLAVLAVLGLQWFAAMHNRVFALGMALFWFALLPVSNFAPMYRPMADRFLYVPMAGVAIMLAALPWPAGLARKAALALAMIASCVLVCVTFQREKAWHDSLALWSDAVKKNPKDVDIRSDLGGAFYQAGRFEESIEQYQVAIDVTQGKVADQFAGMALALDALGRTKEANAAFMKAVSLDKRYWDSTLLLKALIWEKTDAAKLQVISDRNRNVKIKE